MAQLVLREGGYESNLPHPPAFRQIHSVVLFSVADSLMWLGVCLVSKLPQTSSAFCLCIPMSGFIAPINHYFSNTCHDQDLCWVHRGGREALYSSFPGAFRPVGETGGTCVRRKWQPTAVFLPEKSHGQSSLMGYSPKGHKELDTTERLSTDVQSTNGR